MLGLAVAGVAILVAWALRQTYIVTMPIAAAFFIMVLVRPVQCRINDRLPRSLRWIGTSAAMAVILLVAALFGGLIWLCVRIAAPRAGEYAAAVQQLWRRAIDWSRSHGLPFSDQMLSSEGARDRLLEWVTAGFTSVWSIGAILILIFFLVLLMLLEAGRWRRKIERALSEERRAQVSHATQTIARMMRQYMFTRTVISVVSGVSEGLWLWLVGVDLAIVWGALMFALNYIPNVGSVIGVIPPTLIAIVQPDLGLGWAIFALGGLVVIEQVIGNFVDPRLQGRSLDVSPLVLLVSIVFWAWAWGIAGTLLAVPMTVAFIIACAQTEALRPVAILLSKTGDESHFNTESG
jgi:AI-2 transport protein TqsA